MALTHTNILANLDHVNYWMRYREGGVYLHAAPIFHIADFPFMFASPAFGTCQVTIPKFSPQAFCETVARERVTHTVLVPTMINLLTQFADLKKYDLTSLENLGYGGSPIAPELIHNTRQMLPNVKLVQVYGLSETGFLTGLRDHEDTENRLTSCGRPCPGIEIQVVDDEGKEVAIGQHGELVARGANVMRGYWNNLKETNAIFRDGMFRSGDIGYQDADGYIYIVDRLKDAGNSAQLLAAVIASCCHGYHGIDRRDKLPGPRPCIHGKHDWKRRFPRVRCGRSTRAFDNAFAHGAHCISERRFDWRPHCCSSFRSLHTDLDYDSPKPGIGFAARRDPCCYQFMVGHAATDR